MRYKEGAPRHQSLLLPPSLDEYVSDNNPCRVIDAFVDSLDLIELGFTKARTAHTGCKPYSPGDLLKLYIYAYLNQTSSTRRLEKECNRNLEVIWLMKQLAPDFKTIADFRKDNGEAIKKTCKHFILFCKNAGLVNGDLVAIDGSKFKAAASKDQVITRKQLTKQLTKLEQKIESYLGKLNASEESNAGIEVNTQKVEAALDYLSKQRIQIQDDLDELDKAGKSNICKTEESAKLMRSGRNGMVVGYNAQNAVDSKHQVVIHHELTQAPTDNQQLEPMADAVKDLLENELDTIAADAGYSSGEQVANCQDKGIQVAVPANRAINNQGDYFQKSEFTYIEEEDVYKCPAGEVLTYNTFNTAQKMHLYSRKGCSSCKLQSNCTKADKRWVTRHFYEENMNLANAAATPGIMNARMKTVEPPFGTLKRMLNNGRFRCWGLKSAASEYSLGVLSYNLMRAINVLGVKGMMKQLA